MSVSTLFDRLSTRTLLLGLALVAAVICLVLAASTALFSRPLDGAVQHVSALQLRVRQVRADSLALREAPGSQILMRRLDSQLGHANEAFVGLQTHAEGGLSALDMPTLASQWEAAYATWRGQVDAARAVAAGDADRAALSAQLDEAHAIGVSLARTVVANTELSPVQRVAWLQWPLTLAELRVRVSFAQQDLAAEMAAPVSAAHEDTRTLVDLSGPSVSERALDGLNVVRALLASAESQFASATPVTVAASDPEPAARELESALVTSQDALALSQSRWRAVAWFASVAGVISVLCCVIGAGLQAFGLAGSTARRDGRHQTLTTAARRLASDSQRDFQFARTLNRASRTRNEQLDAVVASAEGLAASATRLSKPRELVLNLGRQHADSQRRLSKQMADTQTRLRETKQLAERWSERCEATKGLQQSTRELGERAALLQVNARIRMGWNETDLADDFQRLNDSVRLVMTQTEALVRHQGDAAQRTLGSVQKSLDTHAHCNATIEHAARQLRAYVNGQRDLSGRYDKLDAALSAFESDLHSLQAKAASEQELEDRALQARRATAKFAEHVERLAASDVPESTAPPAPARSAPRRHRATTTVERTEVEV